MKLEDKGKILLESRDDIDILQEMIHIYTQKKELSTRETAMFEKLNRELDALWYSW